MTLYASFLAAALEDESPEQVDSVASGVARVLTKRAEFLGRGRAGVAASSSDRIDAALAYDIALVRLCQQLGLSHHLLGSEPPEVARRRAERELASRLPALAADLCCSPERSQADPVGNGEARPVPSQSRSQPRGRE